MFHHFAQDTDIIELVHQIYMHTQHEDNFKNKNQKDIALMILSPDDRFSSVAVDIAIENNKPISFELMIDMVKSFNDVCSSKMMIKNFNEMLSEG